MKSKSFKFVLIFCLLIFSSAFLFACGGEKKIYAWGQTFTYKGKFSTNYGTQLNDGPTYRELLEREYNKGNLDFANALINIPDVYDEPQKYDLTSGTNLGFEAFVSFLTQQARVKLEETYSKAVVKVGSEAEKTITINDKTYNLSNEPSESGDVFGEDVYGILNDLSDPYNTSKYIGSVDVVMPKSMNDCQTDYQCLVLNMSINSFYIEIPTKTLVDESGFTVSGEGETAISTITLSYTPYLSIA